MNNEMLQYVKRYNLKLYDDIYLLLQWFNNF